MREVDFVPPGRSLWQGGCSSQKQLPKGQALIWLRPGRICPENDAQSASERDYVQSLSGALASFGKIAREAIAKCNELGDAVSADIFTEILRGVEKWLWMVEEHLELQR